MTGGAVEDFHDGRRPTTSPNATRRFEAEPVEDGTRLRYTVILGPGRSRLAWAMRQRPDRRNELIARRLDEHRDNMAAVVHGIADLLATRDA